MDNTGCDPIDSSPPGSFIHGIFQARVLEWGAIAFSKAVSYSFATPRFPGKNSGVDCPFLLQVIFLTQVSNLCLLH